MTAQAEAGWYHVDGDPPGTVRRWNGAAWVGFPVYPEGAQAAPTTAAAAAQSVGPQRGMVGLRTVAVLTQIALALLIVFTLISAGALFSLAGDAEAFALPDTVDFDKLGESAPQTFVLSLVGIIVFRIVGGLLFLVWFYLAYRNMSAWRTTRRAPFWAVVAWLIPFMNLVRPFSMMLELYDSSPSKAQKSLNPVPVMLWWVLVLFGSFGGFLLGLRNEIDDMTSNALQIVGVMNLAVACGLLFQILIVHTITNTHQARRRGTA